MVVFRDHFRIVCAERDVVSKARPAFTIEETWATSTRRSRDCGHAFSIQVQCTRWQRRCWRDPRPWHKRAGAPSNSASPARCVHRQTFPTIGRVELDGLVRGVISSGINALSSGHADTDYQNGGARCSFRRHVKGSTDGCFCDHVRGDTVLADNRRLRASGRQRNDRADNQKGRVAPRSAYSQHQLDILRRWRC